MLFIVPTLFYTSFHVIWHPFPQLLFYHISRQNSQKEVSSCLSYQLPFVEISNKVSSCLSYQLPLWKHLTVRIGKKYVVFFIANFSISARVIFFRNSPSNGP